MEAMSPLTRPSFLAAGLAALGAQSLPARANAQAQARPITVRLANTPDVDLSSLLWQLQNGAYERIGLHVELQRLASSGADRQAVQRLPWNIGAGIELKLLQPVIDFAARYKFIPKSFPASDMIDTNALPGAESRKAS